MLEKKKITDFDEKLRDESSKTLMRQMRELFEKIIETEKWLSQHNFLINAGGAAAVMTYLASDPTPTFAIFPLTIFLTGVVASGIEIRTMLIIYKHLHKDAARRNQGWLSGDYNVDEAAKPQLANRYIRYLNYLSGLYAQFAFAIGSVIGVTGYYFEKI